MRFGENSRKGASSLIVVMLVAVIALAGTAVYVALDRTVLTTDGYALPGSTYTYSIEMSGTNILSESYEIVGYYDGEYYQRTIAGLSGSSNVISPHEFSIGEVPDDVKTEFITVNVPGLGNTSATRYSTTENGIDVSVTTILGGLAYAVNIGEGKFSITSSDISVGTYNDPDLPSSTFTSANNSRATISCISSSTNGNYLYEVTVPSTSGNAYYIGNESKIPMNLSSGSTSFTVESDEMLNDPILTISNNTISEIRCGSTTYSAANS